MKKIWFLVSLLVLIAIFVVLLILHLDIIFMNTKVLVIWNMDATQLSFSQKKELIAYQEKIQEDSSPEIFLINFHPFITSDGLDSRLVFIKETVFKQFGLAYKIPKSTSLFGLKISQTDFYVTTDNLKNIFGNDEALNRINNFFRLSLYELNIKSKNRTKKTYIDKFWAIEKEYEKNNFITSK